MWAGWDRRETAALAATTGNAQVGPRGPEPRRSCPLPRLMPRPIAPPALLLAAALTGACLSASCVREPLGPAADTNPWMGTVGAIAKPAGWPVTDHVLAPLEEGLLEIGAGPADSLFQLASGTRVRVSVTSSSGDSEEVGLRHELCWSAPGAAYVCDEIVFSMDSSHTVWELRDSLRVINARPNIVWWTGEFGALTVLDFDLQAALARVRAWPHVRSADPNGVMWVDGPGAWAHAALGSSVALDLAVAVRGNGVVEVQRGGTVTVSYRQPDGTLLSATAVVP